MKDLYIKFTQTIVDWFRYDLQLHMLWSFLFSMLGLIWFPLVFTGLIVTVIKELLDHWVKGHWSWDDFVFGVVGNAIALVLLQIT